MENYNSICNHIWRDGYAVLGSHAHVQPGALATAKSKGSEAAMQLIWEPGDVTRYVLDVTLVPTDTHDPLTPRLFQVTTNMSKREYALPGGDWLLDHTIWDTDNWHADKALTIMWNASFGMPRSATYGYGCTTLPQQLLHRAIVEKMADYPWAGMTMGERREWLNGGGRAV